MGVVGREPESDLDPASRLADTRIAEQMRLYLRYDGEVGSGTDNYSLNLGVRLSWQALTGALAGP